MVYKWKYTLANSVGGPSFKPEAEEVIQSKIPVIDRDLGFLGTIAPGAGNSGSVTRDPVNPFGIQYGAAGPTSAGIQRTSNKLLAVDSGDPSLG